MDPDQGGEETEEKKRDHESFPYPFAAGIWIVPGQEIRKRKEKRRAQREWEIGGKKKWKRKEGKEEEKEERERNHKQEESSTEWPHRLAGPTRGPVRSHPLWTPPGQNTLHLIISLISIINY